MADAAHDERSNIAALAVEVINHSDVDHVHVVEAASVPGIKRIMRAHGEPSDGAKAEAGVVAKADEEDECRRP